MHTISRVEAFHRAFGHPVAPIPTVPDAKTRLLRFRLFLEELMEFGRAIGIAGLVEMPDEDFQAFCKDQMAHITIDATAEVNLVEAADALGDIDYVTQGANLVFGFPAETIGEAIHRSNMSKLGPDGKPIQDEHGKIVKGPNYFKPDIAAVLREDEENYLWGPRSGGPRSA